MHIKNNIIIQSKPNIQNSTKRCIFFPFQNINTQKIIKNTIHHPVIVDLLNTRGISITLMHSPQNPLSEPNEALQSSLNINLGR